MITTEEFDRSLLDCMHGNGIWYKFTKEQRMEIIERNIY